MNTEIYNGQYEASWGITVEAHTHEFCIFTYNRFIHLVKAFNFGNITLKETKSARKGDVLKRDLGIYFIGYAIDVLAFEESMNRILDIIMNYESKLCTVKVYRRTVTRKEAIFNLRNDSL